MVKFFFGFVKLQFSSAKVSFKVELTISLNYSGLINFIFLMAILKFFNEAWVWLYFKWVEIFCSFILSISLVDFSIRNNFSLCYFFLIFDKSSTLKIEYDLLLFVKALDFLFYPTLFAFYLLWLFNFFLVMFGFLLFHELIVLYTLISDFGCLFLFDGKDQRFYVGFFPHIVIFFELDVKNSVLFFLHGILIHSLDLRWRKMYLEMFLWFLDFGLD